MRLQAQTRRGAQARCHATRHGRHLQAQHRQHRWRARRRCRSEPQRQQPPSPLPLRIFELRAATAFNKADFLPLYQTELQALGDELIAREEMVLAPGETRTIQKVLDPATRFIGVFGAYRSFERAVWRAVAPVQVGKRHQLQIRAASLAVSIQLQVI